MPRLSSYCTLYHPSDWEYLNWKKRKPSRALFSPLAHRSQDCLKYDYSRTDVISHFFTCHSLFLCTLIMDIISVCPIYARITCAPTSTDQLIQAQGKIPWRKAALSWRIRSAWKMTTNPLCQCPETCWILPENRLISQEMDREMKDISFSRVLYSLPYISLNIPPLSLNNR